MKYFFLLVLTSLLIGQQLIGQSFFEKLEKVTTMRVVVDKTFSKGINYWYCLSFGADNFDLEKNRVVSINGERMNGIQLRYKVIEALNPGLVNIHQIPLGMELVLPIGDIVQAAAIQHRKLKQSVERLSHIYARFNNRLAKQLLGFSPNDVPIKDMSNRNWEEPWDESCDFMLGFMLNMRVDASLRHLVDKSSDWGFFGTYNDDKKRVGAAVIGYFAGSKFTVTAMPQLYRETVGETDVVENIALNMGATYMSRKSTTTALGVDFIYNSNGRADCQGDRRPSQFGAHITSTIDFGTRSVEQQSLNISFLMGMLSYQESSKYDYTMGVAINYSPTEVEILYRSLYQSIFTAILLRNDGAYLFLGNESRGFLDQTPPGSYLFGGIQLMGWSLNAHLKGGIREVKCGYWLTNWLHIAATTEF